MAKPYSVAPGLAGATTSKIRELPLVFRVLSAKSTYEEIPRPERMPPSATGTSPEKIITAATQIIGRDLRDASEIGQNTFRTGGNR